MRYLVTKQTNLFESEHYVLLTPEQSLSILTPVYTYGLDTETLGFDVYTKELLSVQFGTTEFQVVIDCKTVDITYYKEFLEHPERLFILHNAKFDLKFFYHKGIVISKVFDTFLAEKILWLGYPPGMHSLALDNCVKEYLGIYLDKSVRGNIIWEGLTERVIIYAADDVKYSIPLMEKQLEKLEEQDLLKSIELENQFVKCLAYIEYCGVKLDVNKWKKKMQRDQKRLDDALTKLNEWVVNWALNPEKKETDPFEMPFQELPFEMTYEETKASRSKYIFHDMQGDLFSGFSGPKCAINWNSAKQVIPLFEDLGFNLHTFDKESGKMKKSIDANIIEPQKHISEIAPIYLDYKGAMKEVSTYGQNFIDQINPVSGRIHTNFNQLMDTGEILPHVA